MSDKDILKDLFSEKLGNYEASVNPKLWSAISSQIGTTAATSSVVGLSLLSKIIIGASISAAVVTGGILLYPSAVSKTEIKQNLEKENSSIFTSSLSKDEVKKLEDKEIKERVVTEEKAVIKDLKIEEDFIESSQSLSGLSTISTVDPIQSVVIENVKTPIQKETYKVLPKETLKKVSTIVEDPSTGVILPDNIVTEEEIVLPNTFTPNSDGIDDEFKILLKNVKEFSIVILDGKNHTVYKSQDPDFIWNGIGLNGEMVEAGNYIYYITGKESNGKEILKYSTLTIFK